MYWPSARTRHRLHTATIPSEASGAIFSSHAEKKPLLYLASWTLSSVSHRLKLVDILAPCLATLASSRLVNPPAAVGFETAMVYAEKPGRCFCCVTYDKALERRMLVGLGVMAPPSWLCSAAVDYDPRTGHHRRHRLLHP